jgi:hypothetical protein
MGFHEKCAAFFVTGGGYNSNDENTFFERIMSLSSDLSTTVTGGGTRRPGPTVPGAASHVTVVKLAAWSALVTALA